MEKAIRKSIEGGYEVDHVALRRGGYFKTAEINRMRLDPLFWQALGKACGWLEKETKKEWFSGLHGVSIPEWRYHWHRLIDHLVEGKDAESFFNELLK